MRLFKVPTFPYEKKLSRIETMRLAINYISFMGELISTNTYGANDFIPLRKPTRLEALPTLDKRHNGKKKSMPMLNTMGTFWVEFKYVTQEILGVSAS